jgi:hypothetical protein
MLISALYKRPWLLLLPGLALLGVSGLAACGAGGPTPLPVVTANPTTPPQLSPTGYLGYGNLATMQVALVGLTPRVGIPEARPTPLPLQPTPTLQLGLGAASNGPGYRSDRPVNINTWVGLVNGQMLTLMAGRLSDTIDPHQGFLTVYQGTRMDDNAPTTHVYLTPMRLGVVQIISVEGIHAELGLGDNPTTQVAFVFDLVTRQWVNP